MTGVQTCALPIYRDTRNLDINWFDIWVMSSEIGVERTWTKKFKVEGSGLEFDDRLLEIREDGLVILHKNDGSLAAYDRKTQELGNLQNMGTIFMSASLLLTQRH